MHICYRCGRCVRPAKLPKAGNYARRVTALHREIETGKMADGSAYYRCVNLCRPCASKHDSASLAQQTALFLAASALTALISLAVMIGCA